jgi:hypothetical protein
VARDLQTAKHGARRGPTELRAAPGKPTSSEVWSALERIGKSQTMRRAPRLVQFLNFVVETTLEGNADYLKETTIGVSAFGRPPDYDPKTDTIVRSQAWRLRAKLRDYYATEGAQDSIIIDIPLGQYAATFSFGPMAVARYPAILTERRVPGSRR